MAQKLTPKQSAILLLSGTFLLALAMELLDPREPTPGEWMKFQHDHQLNRP